MDTTSTRRNFLKYSAIAAAGSLPAAMPKSSNAISPITRGSASRMKLSFAAYSYRKYLSGDRRNNVPAEMTYLEFLDECAKMGLKAVEPTSYYFPQPLTEEYLLDFRRKAFLLGLDISGTAIGNSFTSPPGPDRDKNVQLTRQWIDNAAILGAPCIRIFAGNVPKGGSEDEAYENCIKATQEACDYAAKKGIFLALENHGGIVADVKGLLRITQAVESEWFGVNLDTGNFHTDDPYDDIAKAAPYAVTVQVKINISPKGQGEQNADYDRIIRILAEAGYCGYVALEYEGSEEPKEAVPRHLELIQKAIDKV